MIRRFAFLAVSILACGTANASELPGAPAARSPVVVSVVDAGDGAVKLEARFEVAAPAAAAWSVLTDYDHMQTFIASMRCSRLVERGAGVLLVEQESEGRVLFLHRTFHVRLEVREQPNRVIAFQDVSRASFERYEGSWTVSEKPGGVEVTYRLTAKGGFVMPGFVARMASRKMVGELLNQVRAEITRRARLAVQPPRS